ncbi:MAG TPA: HEAT repeat domain-containing protein [Gemmataceae bacterium]|nr:HEAT repeat domain-containing protein [Gemmataceae bacterium]
MADVTERPQPTPMSLWPWLVAPALMLLLIVGFSVTFLLLGNRGDKPTPQPEPEAPALVAEQQTAPTDTRPKERPAPSEEDAPRVEPAPAPPAERPVAALAPFFPTRRPQPAPDLELAANAPDNRLAAGVAVGPLPLLSETLLLTSAADTAPKEVPRATPEREALYDRVVGRFILYDIGRLRGLEGRKAAADFEALGPDAIRALVRGLNRSATLDASCPVVAISGKLGTLLAACNDVELLAEVRDSIGKGVGPTPYAAYLTALKQASADRLKKSQNLLKPPVPQLVLALKSKDATTRRKAANALGLAGADAKTAVPALVEALKDGDPQVRRYAASALAAIGPPAVAPLLKTAEGGADRQVRSLAYLALGEVRPADGDALRGLVRALKDPEKDIRAAAASALARLGVVAVPPLRQALKDKDASAALALGQIGPPAVNAAIPDLVTALKDDDKELRVAAHHALVRIGAPAVPALSAVLRGADLRGWYSISVALGKIGPDARAAVPALTEGLAHDDKGVRILAANALVKIDPDNAAIKPVLNEAVPALIEVLQQRDGGLRTWAALSLGKIGPDARTSVPALTAALTDADAPVRAAAADALGRVGPRDQAAVVGLVAAQRDADESVRAAAGGALARLGKSAVPALIESFNDPSEEIRAGSAESLGRIGEGAVPGLVTATGAVDDRVRRGAVTALAKVGPAAGPAVPALVEALKDSDRGVRLGAARALAAIKPEKPDAAEALLKRLHEPDEEFRGACRESLVGIGRGAVGPLTGVLKAEDPATRRAAADLLKKIGPDARDAVPGVCAAARDADAGVRAAAVTALRDVVTVTADGKVDAAGEAALQAFAGALHDADEEVRIAAHLGMIRLGRAAAPALGAALAEKEPAVRRLAVETLRKLGPEAKAAAPDLIAALRDADPEVRDGAGWALEAIDPELRAALPALRQALAAPPKPVPAAASSKEACFRTVAELAAVAAGEPGDSTKQALRELSLRRGEQALLALGLAAVSADRETHDLGREMIVKCLGNRPDDKAEAEAARRLKLARRLRDEGAREAADEDVRKVIKTHPRTHAAEEGRHFLSGTAQ